VPPAYGGGRASYRRVAWATTRHGVGQG
jgi:hypothetical protein